MTVDGWPAAAGDAVDLQVGGCKLLRLVTRGDDRGSLIAIQDGDVMPHIARVYYIFGTSPVASRGFHAHRALQQVAICVAGSCRLIVDDGTRTADVRLDQADKALVISPMIWREMHDFSPDCVLMVLASRPYEPEDYIWDRAEFRSLATAVQEISS